MKMNYKASLPIKILIVILLIILPGCLYAQQVEFGLDPQGYIKNWYNSGLSAISYTKDFGKEADIPKERELLNKTPLDFNMPSLEPFNPVLGKNVELKLYPMGSNIFVQNPKFFFTPNLIKSYSLTQIKSDKACELTVSMATIVCKLRVWCNGVEVKINPESEHVGRHTIFKLKIPLNEGVNTLFVRQIDLAVRDNVFDFSLRVEDNKEHIKVVLPGDQNKIKEFFGADSWLQSVTMSKNGIFKSPVPPVAAVTNVFPGDNKTYKWENYLKKMKLDLSQKKEVPLNIRIRSYLEDGVTTMYRDFRFYTLQPPQAYNKGSIESVQKNYIAKLVKEKGATDYYTAGLIALRLLNGGSFNEDDRKALKEICAGIDKRKDCSDFYLAFVFRLYILCEDKLPKDVKDLIKETAVNFRYWDDEKGSDAMYFYTENHSLLFNSCQMIAGNLFPNETFQRSGRTGKEQAEIGMKRINKWMNNFDIYGSEEFLGPGYLSVTLLGMFNVYDFAANEEQRTKMKALLDKTLQLAAISTFDGVCVGAAGRAYDKELINNEISSKQAILSTLTTKLRPRYDNWATSLLTSKYRCGVNMDSLVTVSDLSYISNHGGAKLSIYKQKDYFISSITIPSPDVKNMHGKDVYRPGYGLYQEHLWEAAIGGRARVFVSHPGASTDITSNRPGYWGGNSICPTLNLNKNVLVEIFDIPESHPFQFTHAYFPMEEFKKYEIDEDGHWAFAANGDGYLALWCSQPIQPMGNAFGMCELRAYGGKAAWICMLSSAKEDGNFGNFMKRVKNLKPGYNINSKMVEFGGKHVLKWNDGEWINK